MNKMQVLTGVDAVTYSAEMVELFLDNSNEHIFILTGNSGIGKKTEIKKILKKRNIKPVMNTEKCVYEPEVLLEILKENMEQFPEGVYFLTERTQDFFLNPDIFQFLIDINDKKTHFRGKLILSVPEWVIKDVPITAFNGAWINMGNKDIIDHIEKTLSKS
ncbi:MAG: hypothetical protein K9L75_02275 [Spirochaetia bacterium]|nr:hypothetical protein [Spirochaetia bacterium]